MVAAKLANLGRGRPDNASIDAITQDAAADSLNVGRASVQRAKAVLDSGRADLALGFGPQWAKTSSTLPMIRVAQRKRSAFLDSFRKRAEIWARFLQFVILPAGGQI
jgi:hypothetical protein